MVGSSETDRREGGRFEGEGFEFELTEHPGATRIEVIGGISEYLGIRAMFPRNVRDARIRVDDLADWLERHPLDVPLAEQHESSGTTVCA